jgi:MGT family glycosyltransferase
MEKQTKNQLYGKQILFATVAADGHFNPLTGLAKYLIDLGCDVRWYTSVLYKKRLENLSIPHFPFVKQRDINGTNVDELFPERKLISDAGAKANFDMTHIFAESSPGSLEDIGQINQDFPFDVVITDNAFPAIPLIRAKLNVPVIAIGVMPLAEDSADLGPFGLGLHPPANEEQRKEFIEMKAVFTNVVFKESIETFGRILTQHGVQPGKTVIFDTLVKRADLYLQIGSPSFEFERRDLGSNIRFIGSLLPYTDRSDRDTWFDPRLNHYDKVVLVTQGTVEKDTAKLLEPVFQALKDSDILVVATTGGSNTAMLREKFPSDNIIIEDFLPFDDVMPHADVYITNGGYSGALLSIKHKLPMVTAGIHEGKAEICARVGYFKYGIDLQTETPIPEAINNAVRQVITNPDFKRNISRLSDEMASYHPQDLSATYIAELLSKYERLPTAIDP